MRPILAALLLSSVAFEAGEMHAATRPNIVVILSDDMGYSDLGCYGGEIRTPTLDGLAAEGLRFTQFYNTGRCCPTRAALMTGLHPHQADMGHMTRVPKRIDRLGSRVYRGDLSDRSVTIAEVLREAGYRTYMAGKWHLTRYNGSPSDPKHNWPLQRGFDRFYGTIMGGGSFFDPASLCRGNQWVTPFTDTGYRPWGDRRPAPDEYYYTDAISDNAVGFLRDHADSHDEQPFILYVAYTAAHWPMHALPEDIARYRGAYDAGYDAIRRARYERMQTLGVLPEGCPLSDTFGDWPPPAAKRDFEIRCMEVYAAMVDSMDRGIGRIVAELERQNTRDDTLVLYLQDNGGCAERIGRANKPAWANAAGDPLPDDHYFNQSSPPLRDRTTGNALRSFPALPGPRDTFVGYGEAWANVSNTPFRLYKHYVHEGGISTPLIASWPNGIAARGEVRRQPSHLIDVMPTCVELAGTRYPADHDGRTITPHEGVSLVPAFENASLDRKPLCWEHEGNCAVRDGQWKLVRRNKKPWELYDLTVDRAELRNLAAEYPERTQAMSGTWEAWAERVGVFPSPFMDAPPAIAKTAPIP